VKVLYLHGFASGPASRKARFFRKRLEELGIAVEVPDLSQGDFENLTISGQLGLIESLPVGDPITIIGSSMGGYLGALYAARHVSNVQKLVLLAPAFGFAERWPALVGAEGMERWKTTGRLPIFHYGEQRYRDLGLAMLEDSARWEGRPDFGQPTLIFHGINDDVVPVQASRDFAATHPNTRLFELDSDHELLNVLPDIWEQSKDFIRSN
jgi:uncharacterized protein